MDFRFCCLLGVDSDHEIVAETWKYYERHSILVDESFQS